jgi:phage baseplate assembly protein W
VTNSADFIGRGFRFPFRVDQSGSIALTEGMDDLDTSMRVVLMTAPGERVMRPKFGCAIWVLMFEPINANTLGLMAQAVYRALGQWEPRVDVEDVQVEPMQGSVGAVHISVSYRVRATNDRRNLVYPFYTIPREGES